MDTVVPNMDPRSLEIGQNSFEFDDDGRPRRKGTIWTASAHVITAVIGSGVLSLPWAMAQLGWAVGPIIVLAFSVITLYNSRLLADSYRTHGTRTRNYTYIEVVRSNLGGKYNWLCGLTQYTNLFATSIGYTITASMSMAAIRRSNCFHAYGKSSPCHTSNSTYIVIFGIIQIILSQFPNLHKLSWLSAVAAVMSYGYSTIGMCLAIAKVISNGRFHGNLTGVEVGVDVTKHQKLWGVFQALGNIAFSYCFSMILIEIQDTIGNQPNENKIMKKATLIGTIITTAYYMACGVFGYGAFGNHAPGNLLTGFGFYDPFWLVDIANICIVLHLVGAYQVFVQPLFGYVESFFPDQANRKLFKGKLNLNITKLCWRTAFVGVTTVISMILPFFNAVLGFLGALAFWPLTVFLPLQMHIKRDNIPRMSLKWIMYQILSFVCLLVSLIAAVGSVAGIVHELSIFKPFTSVS